MTKIQDEIDVSEWHWRKVGDRATTLHCVGLKVNLPMLMSKCGKYPRIMEGDYWFETDEDLPLCKNCVKTMKSREWRK